MKRGFSYTDAINHVLIDRNLYRSFDRYYGQNPYISKEELKELVTERISAEDLSDITLVMEVANSILKERKDAQKEITD